jgi:putative oxidoreductase
MTATTLNRILWTVRILLAAAFIAAGGAKLAGVPDMVAMFDKIGLGQGFRYITGAVEVAGGIALLVRAVAGLAGAALAATMLVAVGVHLLVIGGSPLPAIVLGTLSGFVAWHLRPGSRLLRKA